MPIRTVIQKKTRQQAVVKFVGQGTATLNLTDLGLPDETPITPTSAITFLYWSVPQTGAVATIQRNGKDIMYLSGGDNWNLAQGTSFTENEEAGSDITMNITGGNSTVVLCLNKSGWAVPDQQQ